MNTNKTNRYKLKTSDILGLKFPNFKINRTILTQKRVNKKTGFQTKLSKIIPTFSTISHYNYLKSLNYLNLLFKSIPILEWLPKYKISENLIRGITCGVTVSVLQIPQGVAFGMALGINTQIGLYMAFFPVLVYIIFGTSRHIAIGTAGIIALMTREVIERKLEYNQTIDNIHNYNISFVTNQDDFEEKLINNRIQIGTALAIATGIIHLIMAIIGFGKLVAFLCDPLIKGITSAAALHISFYCLGNILGINLRQYDGFLRWYDILIAFKNNILKTNIPTLILSIIVFILMVTMNEIIKPALSRISIFPFPVQFIVLIGATLISKFSKLTEKFNIEIVGKIPVGLPQPFLPSLELVNKLWLDALPIAIVSFCLVISMDLIFSKKHGYKIKPYKELIAIGLSNLVGGCFLCLPICCCLSRSLILEQVGASQLSSFFAAMLTLLILLHFAPFFDTLPKCVLAVITFLALKDLIFQIREVKTFAKQGKLELFIFLATFFSSILIRYDVGIFVGLLTSFISFIIKSVIPYYSVMGTLPYTNTGIYIGLDYHKNAIELPGIKIFRYVGSMNFATMIRYKKTLYNAINLNINKIQRNIVLMPYEEYSTSFQILILDLAAVIYIDAVGCHILTEIHKEMKMIGVKLLLAAPLDPVYDLLVQSMSLGEGPFVILPTIHDAVLLASNYIYI